MTETWECYLRNPEYDDETLHIIHDDINAWPEHSDLDPGDMQGYVLELIAQVRAVTVERDALRGAIQDIDECWSDWIRISDVDDGDYAARAQDALDTAIATARQRDGTP